MNKVNWENFYAAIKNEDWENARQCLLNICETDRRNPQILIKLGDIYQRLGDTNNAISSYHKSAWLLKKEGFIHKALALYKIILRLDPDNIDAQKISQELLFEIEQSKSKKPESTITEALHRESSQNIYYLRGVEFDRQTLDEKLKLRLKDIAKDDWIADQEAIHIPPLFESLPPDEIIHILELSAPRRYSEGDYIIKEGDSGNSIYILQSGKAKVTTHILGQEIELAILSNGDVFGEVAFLTGRPRTASVIALEKINVFEFRKFLLEEIFSKYPDVLRKLHVFYECRVQDTLNKITEKIKNIGH